MTRTSSQRLESTGNVKLSGFKIHVDVLQKRWDDNCRGILRLGHRSLWIDAYTHLVL